ncbi:unnamed protein product [Brassica oleracea]
MDHAAKYICTGDFILTQNFYHNKSKMFLLQFPDSLHSIYSVFFVCM